MRIEHSSNEESGKMSLKMEEEKILMASEIKLYRIDQDFSCSESNKIGQKM